MKKLTTLSLALSIFAGASAFNYLHPDFSGTQNQTLEKILFNSTTPETGTAVATSRMIPFKDLPVSISKALFENFGDYQFEDSVEEIEADGGAFYIVKGQSDRYKIKLRCFPNGSIEEIKKEKIK